MNDRFALRASMLILSALATCGLRAEAPPESRRTEVSRIELMTQNVYVGADIFRVLGGAQCGPLQAVAEIFETVRATNIAERAEAIADLVLHDKPHVIGLQEVALIRSQTPSDGAIVPNPDGSFTFLPNAQDVVYDYLEILLAALAARGLDYDVVVGATAVNADVEFPMAGFDEDCNLVSVPTDLRLTDRDVILVRGDLETANAMSGNFAATLPVQVPLGPGQILSFELIRGFGVTDVTIGKRTYRVANTHLEVGNADDPASPVNTVQFFQTLELIGAVTGTALPLAVLGDFNSSPSPLDARPAYATMVGAGYLDLWTVRQGPPNPGYTCCQEEALRNEDSALDQRIDLVFSRLPADAELLPIRSEVVGDRPNEKTASGLWPSDHAGVATTLKFRR
jgi:endonuclease/exonuclease/phosphatase family metal-dependent hydrolase